MAPSARVKAAFQAMKNIGIPEKKTKPVLKNLLTLYDKNWDHIETDNYSVLADAIFDYEENEAAEKEQKKMPVTFNPMETLEEESPMLDELGRPLKRLCLKQQGEASPSHGQPSPGSGIALKTPKLEPGETEAPPHSQCLQPMTRSPHDSPQSVVRDKGKQRVSLQNAGVNVEIRKLPALVQVGDKRAAAEQVFTSKLKQPDCGALIKVKDAPFPDDMVSLEPLAVVVPERSHTEAYPNISNPADKHNDQQPGASKSVEGITKGVAALVSPTIKENHVKEADAFLKSSTIIDIAASLQGEVKLCLICSCGPNLHDFRAPDLRAVLKKVEDNCIKTYQVMNPEFTLTKIMRELCECILDLGTNVDGIREETTSSQDARIIGYKETYSGSSSLNGSQNVESSDNVAAPSDIELTDALIPLPASEQALCKFNTNDDYNNWVERDMSSTADMNEKSIVVVQEQQLLDYDSIGCLFDMSDITRGEEEIKVSLENSNNEFPFFHYITQNVISCNADVNFPLAEIGDQDHCVSCYGLCLSSSPPCNCAQRMAEESPYTLDGLVKEEFLEECISIVQNRNQYLMYCKECPLERLKNDDMLDPCKAHLKRKFIKECWVKCGCSISCGNRVVQGGMKCKLQVFWTPEGKGWGLRTLEELPKGAFVCEYVGEILTNAEFQKRNQGRSNEKHSYFVLLDANWGSRPLKEAEVLCLDAKFYGNVAKFINHRCSDANLIEIQVEVETPNRQYYHVALFTTRKVDAFEELTWDYGVDFDDNEYHIKAFSCFCGSKCCRNMKRSN